MNRGWRYNFNILLNTIKYYILAIVVKKKLFRKAQDLVGLVLVVAGVVAVMETPVVTAGVVVT